MTQPAVPTVTVAGNVEGSIVVGDNNFVVNTNYGTIINQQAAPRIQRRAAVPQPPRKPRGFVGRSRELTQIEDWIKAGEPVYLHGAPGLGKTTLAKQAANSAAARSQADGVIFLQGVDQEGASLGFGDVIQMAFDASYEAQPPLKVDLAVARTYLSNLHPLVLLSGVSLSDADLDSLANLFPNAPILIEAQQPPSGDVFTGLGLGPLAREDSVALLEELAGPGAGAAPSATLDEIANLLNDTPAALVTIGRAVKDGRLTIERAVAQLREISPQAAPPAQAAEERAYRLVVSTLSTEERSMLMQTGSAPGVSVDRAWLEKTCGGKPVSEALEALGLLQANSPRLRTISGLAAFLGEEPGSEAEILAAREQLLDELVARLGEKWQDFDFVRDELGNLLGLLEWAKGAGHWQGALALARGLDPFLTLCGLWDSWGGVLAAANRAAETLGDQAAAAWSLHQLGTREAGTGDLKAAREHLEQARNLRLSLGDKTGAAYSQHNLDFLGMGASPPSDTPNAGAGWLAPWIAGAAVVLVVAALAYGAARGLHLPAGLATNTAPAPSQTLPPATLETRAVPSGSPTPTQTPSPTITPSPTDKGSTAVVVTATPTVGAPTPTSVPPVAGIMSSRGNCFYGPGPMYLYSSWLLKGARLEATGRNDDGSWIYAEFQDARTGTLFRCWFAASTLKLAGDRLSLQPVYPEPVGPPISPNPAGYPHLQNVRAARTGADVTITWDPYLIPLGARASENSPSYLLELWVCRNGKMIFSPHGTNYSSFTIRDDAGCAEPSHGRLFLSERHGYIGPEEVDWPPAVAQGTPGGPLPGGTPTPSKLPPAAIPGTTENPGASPTPSSAAPLRNTPSPTAPKSAPGSMLRGVMRTGDACFYGPGRMYLYFSGLLKGVKLEAIGRSDDALWVYVQLPGLRFGAPSRCWFSIDSLVLEDDPLKLPPVYPDLAGPPILQQPAGSPQLKNVKAGRDGDHVTITWEGDPLPPDEGPGHGTPPYLLEAWICRNGRLVLSPHGVSANSFTVIDEPGCAEPSHGRLFLAGKHGYFGPVEIDWPPASTDESGSTKTLILATLPAQTREPR